MVTSQTAKADTKTIEVKASYPAPRIICLEAMDNIYTNDVVVLGKRFANAMLGGHKSPGETIAPASPLTNWQKLHNLFGVVDDVKLGDSKWVNEDSKPEISPAGFYGFRAEPVRLENNVVYLRFIVFHEFDDAEGQHRTTDLLEIEGYMIANDGFTFVERTLSVEELSGHSTGGG